MAIYDLNSDTSHDMITLWGNVYFIWEITDPDVWIERINSIDEKKSLRHQWLSLANDLLRQYNDQVDIQEADDVEIISFASLLREKLQPWG